MARIATFVCALLGAYAAITVGAQAATPIEIGEGADVAIAVDGAGTAHVVSRQGPPDAPHGVFYCQVPDVPATTGGCPEPRTFAPRTPGNAVFDRALVATVGTNVIVIWRECCSPEEVNSQVSVDSGANFTPRTLAVPGGGGETPVAPGGDAITDGATVGWTSGVASSSHGFQASGLLAGPPATSAANLFGPVSFGAVSALFGAPLRPLVVEETGDKLLRFTRFDLSGNVNSESTWTPFQPIATTGDGFKRPSLAHGAGEVFLAYTDTGGEGLDRPLLRRYDAAADTFGPATLVADESAGEIDVAVDAAGTVHVVWGNSRGIWWARSADAGATFSEPVRLTDQDPTHLHVSANGDGGFAGFRTLDGGVWVVPLEEPSGDFRFGKTKRNKRRGTAKLSVIVPGPGVVELAKSRKLKPQEKRAGEAGTVRLSLKPKRAAKRKLNRRGRAKVRVKVTFTPDGGSPHTESKKVKLVRR